MHMKVIMAKKKTTKKTAKPKVSKKRMDEIQSTFDALNLSTAQTYENAQQFVNGFQRVSLYETNGYLFTTSNKS